MTMVTYAVHHLGIQTHCTFTIFQYSLSSVAVAYLFFFLTLLLYCTVSVGNPPGTNQISPKCDIIDVEIIGSTEIQTQILFSGKPLRWPLCYAAPLEGSTFIWPLNLNKPTIFFCCFGYDEGLQVSSTIIFRRIRWKKPYF